MKKKEKVRVVFLCIFKSVWKLDSLFKKMLNDPHFEPIILICPYNNYNDEQMFKEMNDCYEYFIEKKFPTVCSYQNGNWVDLKTISPDVVFFTNPHNITKPNYYKKAYTKYLSCYAGYGMPISKYNDYQDQYNQKFHNCIWSIFVQNQDMLLNYKNISSRKDYNVIVTGDAFIEQLREKSTLNSGVWRNKNPNVKKVIWAPHHTILESDKNFKIGTFLENFELFMNLAKHTKESVHWAFKPHPLLKTKLYSHTKWGKEKTDQYFDFWKNSPNTQLEEGDYLSLFNESDALILDSSSFLGEYIFTKKPILYLMKGNTLNFMSDFGIECLNSSYQAYTLEDITHFIENILAGNDYKLINRSRVIKNYDQQIQGITSDIILSYLKEKLKV